MSAITCTLAVMPRKKAPAGDNKVTVSAKIPRDFVVSLNDIRARADWPPSVSQLVERAIAEFIERQQAGDKGKRK